MTDRCGSMSERPAFRAQFDARCLATNAYAHMRAKAKTKDGFRLAPLNVKGIGVPQKTLRPVSRRLTMP